MSIHQINGPCWVVIPADNDEWSAHYDRWDDASGAAAEARAEDRTSKAMAERLPAPCWVAECDGTCEELLGDDGNPLHCTTRTEVLDVMRRQGWTVTPGVISGDDFVYCAKDKPGSADPIPPSPAELEAAGQMRLPGLT
jgi:hypothetical protein